MSDAFVTGPLARLRHWAKALKQEVTALWLAARDPRVSFAAKLLAGAVAAYALSPIDLIPDFVPVLGYLDDLIIVPLGITAAVRLVPAMLMAEFRRNAQQAARPRSIGGAVIVIALWLGSLAAAAWLMLS